MGVQSPLEISTQAKLKAGIKLIVEALEKDAKPKLANNDTLHSINSILIFRTAGMNIFKNSVNYLREMNPHLFIYVITTNTGLDEIKSISGENSKVMPVNDTILSLSSVLPIINDLELRDINEFLILYNNRVGVGYRNIDEVMLKIKSTGYWAFNDNNEFMYVDNPERKNQNEILLEQIYDWHWNLQKARGKIDA